ncbi:ribosomal RNA-processing protein 8 [Anopheles marshallii]|uniref:ribosomal RNA-processing protein 8 n=1 Tax=Anopheles marshallii TaxID=1521116 RepID=UPI00237B3118|nr:ribosomal RNA-processing protein 8 [Anopheles marshallii]
MSKLFNDCEWEDNLPTIGTNFRFSKNWKAKKQKKDEFRLETQNKESEKSHLEENESKKPTGWSVLLKSNKLHGDKRKSEHTIAVNGSEIPSKKLKPNETVKTNGTTKQEDKLSRKSSNDVNQRVKFNSKEQKTISKHAKDDGRTLRDKLTDRLKGSRFRFINEQLYKMPGEEAKKLFQEDPASFDAYHEGYRQQVEQWPMNPLNRMIKCILKLPKNMIIADFGCGEAKLAASVPNKVYSLDLVANNSGVIACDMAKTPLESNFVNVVIFCLSLMGTNLADFFLEANRVLKVGGAMKIAEVSSRFDDVNVFISNVKKCGFTLENKDLKHSLFYFFNFKKERTVLKGSTNIKQFSLKPCLYKKR